jgi:hypothetical protein
MANVADAPLAHATPATGNAGNKLLMLAHRGDLVGQQGQQPAYSLARSRHTRVRRSTTSAGHFLPRSTVDNENRSWTSNASALGLPLPTMGDGSSTNGGMGGTRLDNGAARGYDAGSFDGHTLIAADAAGMLLPIHPTSDGDVRKIKPLAGMKLSNQQYAQILWKMLVTELFAGVPSKKSQI